MPNERKTESLVRTRLQAQGYFSSADLVVEEQQSDSPRVSKLLKNASKKGDKGGHPEFIISSKRSADFIIVIECKASPLNHASKTLDKYADYAVDGALLYASFLAKEFDVLAIGISGETESALRISHFIYMRGSVQAVELPPTDILPFDTYYQGFLQSDIKFRQDYDALLSYSRELNELLQGKKIKESHRGLLICGILVALENAAFRRSFRLQNSAKDLADNLVESIVNEFKRARLPVSRITSLEAAFSFIRQNTTLTTNKVFFVGLIEEIDGHVNAFIKTHKYHDALGQFYIQFLRYANNDKGLGIVLTPPPPCR